MVVFYAYTRATTKKYKQEDNDDDDDDNDDVRLIGRLAPAAPGCPIRQNYDGWEKKSVWSWCHVCELPQHTQTINREVKCQLQIYWLGDLSQKGEEERERENIESAASNLYYFRPYLKNKNCCAKVFDIKV